MKTYLQSIFGMALPRLAPHAAAATYCGYLASIVMGEAPALMDSLGT